MISPGTDELRRTGERGRRPAHGASGPARSGGVNGVDLVVEGLRALGPDPSLTDVRRLVTATALSSLPGAVDASLTIPAGNGFSTVAQTSELPLTVDSLQYERGGPCVDAAAGSHGDAGSVVQVDDLRTDRRWPAFAHAVVEQTPVLGVLSYRLVVGHQDQAIGSLNVYATTPHAFTAHTVAAGERLAAYTAVALAYAVEREKTLQLERALHSSRDIGAALGILMCRHLITRERAFELLNTASQHHNRKVRDLAQGVILTGDLTVKPMTQTPESTPGRPE